MRYYSSETKNFTPLDKAYFKKRLRIKALTLFFIILSIFNIIIWGNYFLFNRNKKKLTTTASAKVMPLINETVKDDKIEIIKTGSTSLKPNPQDQDIFGITMKYTSYKLGITFNYLTHWGKKLNIDEEKYLDVFVTRNQNKVCISYDIGKNNTGCDNGDYIEVINKDPAWSFQKAIENYFLQKNQKSCHVNIYKYSGYEIAKINPGVLECEEEYTKNGMNKYFRYDSKFPNRFVLVSLGKYPALADVNYNTWDKTLFFID